MRWSAGRTLNMVAHEDDDLLFLNPDLLHAIQAGRSVRTVFLTAGDCGADPDYWLGREAGAKAAYAQMCGVANSWSQTDAEVTGHRIPVFTLIELPSVSLVFMRLPDGNIDGSGFPSTNHETLQLLWVDSISTIHVIDGSSSYNKVTLTSTLTSLISAFQPDQINTQDYIGTYGDGDHSDHHSVAYFVQAATQQSTTPHNLTGYEGYTVTSRLANVTRADLIAKQNAFYSYAYYDRSIGGVPKIFPESWRMNMRLRRIAFMRRSLHTRACRLIKSVKRFFIPNSSISCFDTSYAPWLQRQYVVDSRSGVEPIAENQYQLERDI